MLHLLLIQRFMPTQTLNTFFCPQQWQKFNDSSQQVRGVAFTVPSSYSCTCRWSGFQYRQVLLLPASHSQQDSSRYPDAVLRTEDEIQLQRLNKGTESLRLCAFFCKGASLLLGVHSAAWHNSDELNELRLECEGFIEKDNTWSNKQKKHSDVFLKYHSGEIFCYK